MPEDEGAWFYLSFADPQRAEGEQWLGGAYVRADDLLAAVDRAWRLQINPGGEIKAIGPLDAEHVEATVPEPDRERLLNEDELRAQMGPGDELLA